MNLHEMGNAMRRYQLLLAIGTAGLLSSTAQALQPHGVASGASLSYTAANSVGTDIGNVFVDGVAINLNAHSALITAYCLTNGTTINKLAYYYVYYVYVAGGGNNNYYISNVAPAFDGHPSANIMGAGGAGCAVPATLSAVFLGSFLTDNTPAVVPFWRNGDDVQFNGALGLNGTITLPKPALPTTPICGSPVLPNRFPLSANAYLLDIAPLTTSCNASNTVYLCPVVTAEMNCPMSGLAPTDPYVSDIFNIVAPVPGYLPEYKQYRLQASLQDPIGPEFCMNGYNGVCGANLITVNYAYVGYVEKIPLPTEPY